METLRNGSRTKSIIEDMGKPEKSINFSEESSRTIHEMDSIELHELGQIQMPEGLISSALTAFVFDLMEIEKASHACALPKKSECRRAACSGRRPILTREAECVHDLWAFFEPPGAYEAVQSLFRSIQFTLTE